MEKIIKRCRLHPRSSCVLVLTPILGLQIPLAFYCNTLSPQAFDFPSSPKHQAPLAG